jgi:Ca2+-transporting ATPase
LEVDGASVSLSRHPKGEERVDANPCAAVGSSAATAQHVGLTSAEAQARLAEFGSNLLVTTTRGARVMRWLHTLSDPMALMLAGAALLYLVLGKPHEAAVLAAVVVPVLGVDVESIHIRAKPLI